MLSRMLDKLGCGAGGGEVRGAGRARGGQAGDGQRGRVPEPVSGAQPGVAGAGDPAAQCRAGRPPRGRDGRGDGAWRDGGDQAGQRVSLAGARDGGEERERRGEDACVQHGWSEFLPCPALRAAVVGEVVGGEGDVGELAEGVAAAVCRPGGVAEAGEEAADGLLRPRGCGSAVVAGRAGGVKPSAAAARPAAVAGLGREGAAGWRAGGRSAGSGWPGSGRGLGRRTSPAATRRPASRRALRPGRRGRTGSLAAASRPGSAVSAGTARRRAWR